MRMLLNNVPANANILQLPETTDKEVNLNED